MTETNDVLRPALPESRFEPIGSFTFFDQRLDKIDAFLRCCGIFESYCNDFLGQIRAIEHDIDFLSGRAIFQQGIRRFKFDRSE